MKETEILLRSVMVHLLTAAKKFLRYNFLNTQNKDEVES